MVKSNKDNFMVEKVVNIPLEQLHYFNNFPFKIVDNEAMTETVKSIKEYGVLVPITARPHSSGGYEIISGHRRHRASEIAKNETIPVIIRNLDDDLATIIMVDSNMQREDISPSERAFAYKMKIEAIKRQGTRSDLTSGQIVPKLQAREKLAQEVGESSKQISRYIRLTELNSNLLNMVDNKQLGFTPAVELSYLSQDEQAILLDVMESEQATPSLSQAQRIKKLSKTNECTFDTLTTIMREEKKSELDKVSFSTDEIKKYFPKSYTPKKMEQTILKLLANWYKKRINNKER